MKAIVKTAAAAGAALLDVPEPTPLLAGDVLVQIQSVSICGTDFHVYSWDAWAASRVHPPIIMGHEWAGTVIRVGADVESLRVGDFVSGESHRVCGHCRQCRLGQAHVCQNTKIFGVDTDGCFAERFAVPEASVIKNDPRISPEIACVQDPLGNAVHAALAGEMAGRTVAVLGCGPIGLFAVAVCHAVGSGAIWASDTVPYRLELARKAGADFVAQVPSENLDQMIADGTNSEGVDVVLEMSGAPAAIQQALRLVRPGGRVALLGIPNQAVELRIAEEVIFKGVTVQGIVGRRLYETWYTMQNLLAGGRLNVAPIITHRLPFENFADGMELMRTGQCGKVVLTVAG